MRKFLLFSLLCLTPLFASAQTTYGLVKVSFGTVRNLDGTTHSVKDLWLPYTAERIDAKVVKPRKSTKPYEIPQTTRLKSTTIYNCDSGSGYAVTGDADSSSLDDLVLSGGSGLPWENLTFGADITANHAFLIRWRCYSTFTQGLGAGVQAFNNEFADFGVIYPATAPGTYKITISVAAAGVVAPSNICYMAQQFRDTTPTGEGAFDPAIRNVYNPVGPPTVGSSDDVFWYDNSPSDGIYSEDEADNFGEGNLGNHLRTITVGGTAESLKPFQYAIEAGTFTSGDVTSLWFNDDTYLVVKGSVTVPRNAPPIVVSAEGLASTATATSLTFRAESHSPAGVTQKIELFNYQTNAYDTVDTRAILGTDSITEITITNNPSKYVNATNRHLKARVSIILSLAASRANFNASIDQMNWSVTHP